MEYLFNFNYFDQKCDYIDFIDLLDYNGVDYNVKEGTNGCLVIVDKDIKSYSFYRID